MHSAAQVLELDVEQMEAQLEQIEQTLGEQAARPFRLLLGAYLSVLRLIEHKNTTIGRLRRLLFGSASERTREVVPEEKPIEPPPGGG